VAKKKMSVEDTVSQIFKGKKRQYSSDLFDAVLQSASLYHNLFFFIAKNIQQD